MIKVVLNFFINHVIAGITFAFLIGALLFKVFGYSDYAVLCLVVAVVIAVIAVAVWINDRTKGKN